MDGSICLPCLQIDTSNLESKAQQLFLLCFFEVFRVMSETFGRCVSSIDDRRANVLTKKCVRTLSLRKQVPLDKAMSNKKIWVRGKEVFNYKFIRNPQRKTFSEPIPAMTA